jgi:hypothetical protein
VWCAQVCNDYFHVLANLVDNIFHHNFGFGIVKNILWLLINEMKNKSSKKFLKIPISFLPLKIYLNYSKLFKQIFLLNWINKYLDLTQMEKLG